MLESLTGHEERVGAARPLGVQHGGMPGRKNWLDRRKDEAEYTDGDPDVLIIGEPFRWLPETFALAPLPFHCEMCST